MTFFPISWLYPVGEKQEQHTDKFEKEFEKPSLIADDYLFIKQFAPKDLEDNIILTDTTTEGDRDDLENRGVRALITTTPRIDGRSYGTNVLEAALVALAGRERELTSDELQEIINTYQLKPNLEIF